MVLKPLREIISFKGGGTPSKQNAEYWNGDIPWATVKDFTGTRLSSTQDSITGKGLANSASNLITKGHVIIPTRMSLGKAAINTIDLAINQDLKALIPKVDIDAEYLLCAILSLKDEIIRQGSGATVKGITQEALYKLQIPLPCSDDQKRIAHLLGKVEGLIGQRKQHLQYLDDLLKSVFLEMFGDPVRNEKGWDKPYFETIIVGMRNGLSPSKAGVNKGRVYTLSSITGARFQEIYKEDTFSQIHDKYFPTTSDFLVCRGNGNIGLVGKGYFFAGKAEGVIFPDTIIAVSIQPNVINKSFLEVLWQTRFIRQQIESNARTTNGTHKINQGVIKKIKLIKPPPELQKQFADIAERIESARLCYQQSLVDLEYLYGALSQKVFKGELDLSRVPLPTEPSVIDEEAKPMDPQFVGHSFELTKPVANINLRSTEDLKAQVDTWLAEWLKQLGDIPLVAQDFMEVALQNMRDHSEAEEPEWGIEVYDRLKAIIFRALNQGRIYQSYEGANKRVQVTAAKV